MRGIDEARALREIARIEQAAHRHRHEIRIAEIAVAIGIGQPPGLGEEMRRRDRARPEPGEIEALQQSQHLQQGHRP